MENSDDDGERVHILGRYARPLYITTLTRVYWPSL